MRLATSRRLAVLLPLVVGAVVGVILWRAGERTRAATPVVVEHVCTFTPPPAPPPKPAPPAAAWDGLARCLREYPWDTSVAPVTVADVWHWVEVERDPVWFSEGAWWFPLSGEGDPQMPSGLYVAVPLEASAPCRGAIIN